MLVKDVMIYWEVISRGLSDEQQTCVRKSRSEIRIIGSKFG
jgi:hypothetical protein